MKVLCLNTGLRDQRSGKDTRSCGYAFSSGPGIRLLYLHILGPDPKLVCTGEAGL